MKRTASRVSLMGASIIVPMQAPMVYAKSAAAQMSAPKILAVTPVNGTETTDPVHEVGVTFAGDVIFEQMMVEAPDGTMQVLFEKGEEPFIGRTFAFALRTHAKSPGVYSVYYLAWSLDHKSSTSGSYTFTIAGVAAASELAEPSFDCNAALDDSIEAAICASEELRVLDRDVQDAFDRAQAATPRAKWPDLIAEQDSFLANRDLCMDAGTERDDCIAFAYESRLQRLGDWMNGEAWAE